LLNSARKKRAIEKLRENAGRPRGRHIERCHNKERVIEAGWRRLSCLRRFSRRWENIYCAIRNSTAGADPGTRQQVRGKRDRATLARQETQRSSCGSQGTTSNAAAVSCWAAVRGMLALDAMAASIERQAMCGSHPSHGDAESARAPEVSECLQAKQPVSFNDSREHKSEGKDQCGAIMCTAEPDKSLAA